MGAADGGCKDAARWYVRIASNRGSILAFKLLSVYPQLVLVLTHDA